MQNANRVYRVQHSLVTQRALPEKFRTATSLQNSIGQRPHNNDGGGGRRRGLLSQTLSEIGIKAVRIVHIALRRADPRHQHLAISGAVHNVEAQRPRREQLLECAHVDGGVHGVGGSCLLAALGRHVHHYLARVKAFSVEELERVVAEVLQRFGVTQLLPQSQRPRVDGVRLAACT